MRLGIRRAFGSDATPFGLAWAWGKLLTSFPGKPVQGSKRLNRQPLRAILIQKSSAKTAGGYSVTRSILAIITLYLNPKP